MQTKFVKSYRKIERRRGGLDDGFEATTRRSAREKKMTIDERLCEMVKESSICNLTPIYRGEISTIALIMSSNHHVL